MIGSGPAKLIRQADRSGHHEVSGRKEKQMKALLALEDGMVFKGRSFTGRWETEGEVVFNTSMTGYQEVLTDPSYCGQMVTMTYPLIGNYGVNETDVESDRIHVKAFLVKEYQPYPSNFRSLKVWGTILKRTASPAWRGLIPGR